MGTDFVPERALRAVLKEDVGHRSIPYLFDLVAENYGKCQGREKTNSPHRKLVLGEIHTVLAS